MRPFGFGPRLRGAPPAHLMRPPSIRLNQPTQIQSVSQPVVVATCGYPMNGSSNLTTNTLPLAKPFHSTQPLPDNKLKYVEDGRKSDLILVNCLLVPL